jgi:hypothetical protein
MSGNRRFGRYKVDALRDVLSAYADSLIGGDEGASQVVEQHPDEVSALEDLFEVSSQLYDALVSVKPKPRFVSDLRTELQKSQTALVASRREERRRRVMQITNTLGTILAILAITALLTRVVAVIIMLMTLRARRRRPVAAA